MRSPAPVTGRLVAGMLAVLVPLVSPVAAQAPAPAARPAAPPPGPPSGPPAAAPAPPPAGPLTCDLAEHRQFDFWIGAWDVFGPDGTLVGTNHITLILGTCVLLENWKGRSGMEGWSFNVYDRAERRWHQTWVDSRGTRLDLVGTMVGRKMVLTGEKRGPDGVKVIDRITWEPIDPAHVRQLWEQSKDDGATWSLVFDGRYVRQAPPAAEAGTRRDR